MSLTQGIHQISAEAYHADPCLQPSLSNSLMTVLLNQTPRHAWLRHPRLNPAYEAESGGGAFDIGTAAHAMLLEGENIATVIDAEDWRTKAAQEARDKAYLAGKIPLLKRQHAAVQEMLHVAMAYIDSTSLKGILGRGKAEQTLIWRSANVWCRARLDFLVDDRSVILDYKTTGVAGPAEFIRKQMVAHGYDTQSVFYPQGLNALGHHGARFLFLVQESFAPFMCYLVEPAESMVELASHKITRAMALWRDCLGSDRWPGYSTEVHQADAPVWAIKEEELA